MAAGATVDTHLLASSLSALAEKVVQKVEDCKDHLKTCPDLNEFLSVKNPSGIRQLFHIMPVYAEVMEKVGVRTKIQLEELWARRYVEEAVRDSVEQLLEAEEGMAEFIQDVDKQLDKEEDSILEKNLLLHVGDHFPEELVVTEVPSGQDVPLGESWKGSRYTLFVLMRHFG